ncbi:MAG TPA: chromate resistance protein [Burkholderiaceae bacterium]|nr:chromate resistance protein [Burkholderiaceae bacterium]HQR71338.1 chromate resistance protein [Burkholderiaceae bacterium]
MQTDWLALVLTLPTSPSSVRVRIWRALKASGCGALRDGVYLLPARPGSADVFDALADEVRQAGGEATRLALTASDREQQAQFEALFDRSAEFKAFEVELARQRRALRSATETAGRRVLRSLVQRLDALQAIDFFADGHGAAAATALEELRAACEARWSPGEPRAKAAGRIESRDPADYQGRTWATRARPWVDRLASAWLVARFIDRSPRFVWLKSTARVPKAALGFDFDGATFSHADGKVTYEVIAASFGLEGDEALRKLGEAVHYIDVGGAASEEAAGLEALIRGLQTQHRDDDALLAASMAVFDALYAGLRGQHDNG